MPRMAKERYGVADIANAAGVHYRTALRAQHGRKFDITDLLSVAEYICERRKQQRRRDERS